MRASILLVYLTMLAAAGITGGPRAGSELRDSVFAAATGAGFITALEFGSCPRSARPAWEPQSPESRVQGQPGSPQPADDPDALYARRENIESAKRAAGMWADAVRRNPKDFEAAWKLARARHYLGDHFPAADRRAQYDLGVAAARLAVAAQPNRPEGHFWLGSSLGGLGELSTWAGLKYRNTIKDEFETTVRLDPGWDEGSGLIALGRWYFEVPSLFGGSKTRSEEYLRRALGYDPYGTIVRLFLAETLLGMGRTAEARSELQKAIDAPVDPEYGPEDREWKQKARELLRKGGI